MDFWDIFSRFSKIPIKIDHFSDPLSTISPIRWTRRSSSARKRVESRCKITAAWSSIRPAESQVLQWSTFYNLTYSLDEKKQLCEETGGEPLQDHGCVVKHTSGGISGASVIHFLQSHLFAGREEAALRGNGRRAVARSRLRGQAYVRRNLRCFSDPLSTISPIRWTRRSSSARKRAESRCKIMAAWSSIRPAESQVLQWSTFYNLTYSLDEKKQLCEETGGEPLQDHGCVVKHTSGGISGASVIHFLQSHLFAGREEAALRGNGRRAVARSRLRGQAYVRRNLRCFSDPLSTISPIRWTRRSSSARKRAESRCKITAAWSSIRPAESQVLQK